MDLQLRGKIALVSGASRGIGRAIAAGLAREGCDLILTARDGDAVQKVAGDLASQFGVNVRAVAADISTEPGIQTLCAEVAELDILVNNAGAIPGGSMTKVAMEDWKHAWDLKVISLRRSTKNSKPDGE
jgi:hypothetical protein